MVQEAVGPLQKRTADWLGDSGVGLHALPSLVAEVKRQFPQAIFDVTPS